MSATDVAEDGILSLLITNADFANIGDAGGLLGSVGAGVFWSSLHSATPADTGTQGTSEATYSPYARVSIARSVTGWTVTSGVADNDSAITFAACTSGTTNASSFGLGTSSSGTTGILVLYGDLTAVLAISNGITPSFAAGALDITLT